MEIGINVIADEKIRNKVVRHANSCLFTMVAVDDERKPVSVPALELISFEQRRRHSAAIVRKQLRQEFVEIFENLRQVGINEILSADS